MVALLQIRPLRPSARLRRLGSLRPGHLVAVVWAERSLRRVRVDVAAIGTRARVASPPDRVKVDALRLVRRYLKWRGANCIERSLIAQSWLCAHGRSLPIVVGVGNKEGGFMAHAWIPGYDHPGEGRGYREITRLEP